MIAARKQDAPRYIRAKDISEQLAIDIQTVYRAIQSGELPSTRFGKQTILVKEEDAQDWIARNSMPNAPVASQ